MNERSENLEIERILFLLVHSIIENAVHYTMERQLLKDVDFIQKLKIQFKKKRQLRTYPNNVDTLMSLLCWLIKDTKFLFNPPHPLLSAY